MLLGTGWWPTTAGAVAPNSNRLYVANSAADSVSAIDAATGRVVFTVAVGRTPWSIAASPDARMLYVANLGSPFVSVIDTKSAKVTRRIGLASGARSVVVSPDGTRLYIGEFEANAVATFNTSTGVVTSVSAGTNPYALALSPDGRRLYVADVDQADNAASTVTVIDTTTNRVAATIPGFNGAEGVAASPDGRTVYASSINANTVLVIDAATTSVTRTITGLTGPQGIAVSPLDGALFVANSGANTVSVARPPTATPRSIVVGAAPAEVSISADGTTAYVSNFTSGTVSVIDARTGSVVRSIAGGTQIHGLVVTAAPADVHVLSISSALARPQDAFSSVATVGVSIGIAAAGVLLLTFPSQLFNLTLEENYDDLRRRWRSLLARVRLIGRPAAAKPSAVPGERTEAPANRRVWFGAVIAVGALFGSLLDPHFGLNRSSLAGYLAMVITLLIEIFVPALLTAVYLRTRKQPLPHHLNALPGGLLIAAACVLVSRVTNFQPGYLYGIVAGVVFVGELGIRQKGHLAALTSVATLVLAIVCWLSWVPLDRAAVRPGAFAGLVVADDLLASLVVGGLVGVVFGLVPLEFLPGAALKRWHRAIWAVLLFAAGFGVVDILLLSHRPGGRSNHVPIALTITLFVLFGAMSIGLREIYVIRRRADGVTVKGLRARLSELTAPTGKPEHLSPHPLELDVDP